MRTGVDQSVSPTRLIGSRVHLAYWAESARACDKEEDDEEKEP
jgi:hypothetical protein